MKNDLFNDRISRFSIRKLNVGVCSVLLGTLVMLGTAANVSADEAVEDKKTEGVVATTEIDKAETPVVAEATTAKETTIAKEVTYQAEAIDAGKLIKEAGIEFDQAYTSVLKRAIKTTNLALEAADQLWVPVEKSWRLNERHYGGLTGKNKAEAAEQFGDEQVHIWRRSYDVLPPAMDRDDEHSAHTDRRYASLDDSVIPDAENLKVTLERALPFWEDKIAPALKDGKNVFVGAHGNSIRALVKHIKQLSDDEIMGVEIPNFPPLVFEFDEKLNVVKEYYLGK